MLITLTVLLGSIAALTWLLVYSANAGTRKRRSRMQQQLNTTAQQYATAWTDTDIGKYRALAWSREGNLLFFMDCAEDTEQLHVIQMDAVTDCRLIETGGNRQSSQKAATATAALQMASTGGPPVVLTFYDEWKDGVFEKARLTTQAQEARTRILQRKKQSIPS